MQGKPIFLIAALLIVALYYLTPLRGYIESQFQPAGSPSSSKQTAADDEPFDKLSIDLLMITDKVANLEGKIRILAMAKEHPDWFSDQEYAHVPVLIAEAEQELEKAKSDYERIKNEYARQTATKFIKQSLSGKEAGGEKARAQEAS